MKSTSEHQTQASRHLRDRRPVNYRDASSIPAEAQTDTINTFVNSLQPELPMDEALSAEQLRYGRETLRGILATRDVKDHRYQRLLIEMIPIIAQGLNNQNDDPATD